MKPIIEVRNISKKYKYGHNAGDYVTLRDTLSDWIYAPFKLLKKNPQSDLAKGEFWALENISFEVYPGEIVGIIGGNGAGKSTLLKILSQITPPTSGEIILHGRVASLLEVGTGFNPELTGRENIFLNGSILGMTRSEINNNFKDIIKFADIGNFVDTPVKHYSSGMYMRLAFSVAAHLRPEILLVDEVLAVGDYEFQQKCLGKMESTTKEGRTVLLVSHNLMAIKQLCKNTLVLNSGKLCYLGPTEKALEAYTKSHSESIHALTNLVSEDDAVSIIGIKCNNHSSNKVIINGVKTTVSLEIKLKVKKLSKVSIEAKLKDVYQNYIGVFFPGLFEPRTQVFNLRQGIHTICASIILPQLNKGDYYLDLIMDNPGIKGYANITNAITIHSTGRITSNNYVVEQDYTSTGLFTIEGHLVIK